MISPPLPGALHAVLGPHQYAVHRSDGVWTVLARQHHEYTLLEVVGLETTPGSDGTIVGLHWADIFDALAQAHRLDTTWAEELDAYQTAAAELIGQHLTP